MELEKLLSREQKAAVVKSAIHKANGDLKASSFSVDYDRRFSTWFQAVATTRDNERHVHITFSVSPIHSPETFSKVVEDAAQAIDDILHQRVDAAAKPKRVNPVVECPCCEARVMVMEEVE